jgi:two-component system, OmpR family, phosphate regulon sensor histidine kinase PhoR
MTRKERLWGFLWFIAIMIILCINFSIAFLLTGWIYTLIGQAPVPLLIQLINSIGGLLLTALIVMIAVRLFQPRMISGEMRIYRPIIDALERIAKGDFSVRVDSVFDEHAQYRGILGELVNTVNRTARELDQMESLRQEFISNVSHEIQSPLTSISGFARALQNDQLSAEDRRHYLTIIETESMRLSKLTDNLLRLASLEAEQVKFEPKSYRLDKQIRDLILACEPQWMAKALEIDVSLAPVEITADEDLLSQVWINLIHNSIKFTPERGKVCVELQRQGDRIEFRIADTGPGISEEDLSRIFERFYKADKSRTRSNNGGSGLGLSIVQKIVDMHQGTVAADSQLGTGATFTVSLPGE